MSDDEFMTAEEVAATLRVTTTTIRRLIKSGELTAVRVGGQWRISVIAFNEYISRATAKATA